MKIIAFLLLLVASKSSISQIQKSFPTIDTSRKYPINIKDDLNEIKSERSKVKSLIFPCVLIAYGFIALETQPIRKFDYSMESEIIEDHPHFHTPIDNFS